MADCNIRNIDDSLMRAMKAEALRQDKTLREWCIWVFAANCQPAPAMFGGEPAKDKLSELRKLVSAIKPEPYQDETAVEASAWECPICDKPLVRYMKRGINFGKLACAECDQAWSEAQLKRR